MRLILAILLTLTLPLLAQRVPVGDLEAAKPPIAKPAPIKPPVTDAEWKAIELPTKAADLKARMDTLKPYCEAGIGLGLGGGPTWRDDQGALWVAHSHSTLSEPEVWESDVEGNRTLVSGGDRIILVPAAVDAALAGKLCIPVIEGSTDRVILNKMLAGRGARYVREMPAKWTAVQSEGK